jgi:predicted nucleic acid-binding protein
VEAVALLAENLTHSGHEFWTERLQLPAAIKGMETGLQGYRQLTDAYLLALASRRKGVLATFDRATRTLGGDAFHSAVEIVPAR